MKKFLLVSLILLFSCEELQESSNFLEYDFYMDEGWLAFQEDEWDLAVELFNTGLSSSSASNYSEAFTGLGWTYMYHANLLPGEINKSNRDFLRILAENNFKNAKSEGIYEFNVWYNALAGLTFIYSYLADTALAAYFNDPTSPDSLLWELMEEFSNKTLTESDELLERAPSYNFNYDSCVNIDNIHIIRARTYLRLDSLSQMLTELSNLTTLTCTVEPQTVQEGLDCLSELSAELSTCN